MPLDTEVFLKKQNIVFNDKKTRKIWKK